MATTIQLRHDTASNWTQANPVLAQGEMVSESDTLKLKLGDGTTAYNSLAYFSQVSAGATVAPLMDGAAAVGIQAPYARQDHRHPSDTTLAPLTGATFTGPVTATTLTGALNGSVGATTPSTGAFTTLSALIISGALNGTVGATTPSTGAFTTVTGTSFTGNHIGSGAGLTAATVPVAALNTTGTASSSTFLNGSGAWTTPVSGFTRTSVADANYTIASTTATILAYTSITAARILTLPAATTSGQLIWVVDESGLLSSTLSLTIQRAGTDLIEGQTSYVLTGQYAALCLSSNGSGKWTILTYEELPIAIADASYVIPFREDLMVQINSLTASRTITLPSANTAGQRVTIEDFSGKCSQTNTIIVTAAGTDTINGGVNPFSLSVGYARIVLESNGAGKWTCAQNNAYVATVNSFTEYAYNTSTTTTSDSTSFGYGSGGAAVQAFAPSGGAYIAKTVQFLQPIQPTDLLVLEFNTGGYGWVSADQIGYGFGGNTTGTVAWGTQLNLVSSTTAVVQFFAYSTSVTAWTWATMLTSYPNAKWRVRKTSQGNFAQGSPSYSTTIGNASSTSFTVTHNLGTPIYSVTAWETTGSLRQITSGVIVSNPTSTTVTLTFTTAPALNAIQVLVQSNGGTSSNNDRLSNLANAELTISAAATAVTAQWNRCYATSAAYALTLPPVLASAGKIVGVRIDSSSTYNVTVTGNGTDLIDGSNTYLMIPRECCEFKSDGTTWQRISNNTVDGTWTPVPTNLTVVGTPTYTGRYKKIGNMVFFNIGVSSTTSTTSSNGSSLLSLPFVGITTWGGTCNATNAINGTSLPTGYTWLGNLYLPAWGVLASVSISGSFAIA